MGPMVAEIYRIWDNLSKMWAPPSGGNWYWV